MPKFKPERDHVRVTDLRHEQYDEVGRVVSHEPEYHYAYGVAFGSVTHPNTYYFPAAHLVLAPNPQEGL